VGPDSLNKFQLFQNPFILDSNRNWSPQAKIVFEVNYGFDDLETMNKFLHRNFFRFVMDFELKKGEFKV
jgi:hypothetical protein